MIFLSITGGLTAAITYDRRQKKRAQQKWADLVAHISKETLPIEQNRRKLTIFLSAPPGDGLRSAREYFIEYVKPILVSAALDYDVVEGRREGDVRAGLAEKIREHRRQAGEQSATVLQEPSKELVIAETRRRMGVTDEPGPLGDIVIGRHTWKEYVRGLHEGWLGPLDPPPTPELPTEAPSPVTASDVPADTPVAETSENPDSSSTSTPEQKPAEPEKEKEKEKPKGPTPAYISTLTLAALSSSGFCFRASAALRTDLCHSFSSCSRTVCCS